MTRRMLGTAAASLVAAALVIGTAFVVQGQAPTPRQASPALSHKTNVRAVYQIHGDRWKDGAGMGLHYMRKLLNAYDTLGVPDRERHLVAVVHGSAGYWLLNDASYASFNGKREHRGATNPNAGLVAELVRRGVRVEMCANTMKDHGWRPEDLLPGVVIVPGAYPRVIDLQLDGYAHVVFD